MNPQGAGVCHEQQYSDLRLNYQFYSSPLCGTLSGGALWREVCLLPEFSCQNVGKCTTRRLVQLQACSIQCSGSSISHSYAEDFSYPAQCYVEVDTDIFSPSPLPSSFLSSPICLWHSSHSPLLLSSSPAPTSLPLSPFLCAHISVFPTRLPLCFSFPPCLFLSSPTIFSFPKIYHVLGSLAVTTLTSSLDTVLALSLICLFLLSFHP